MAEPTKPSKTFIKPKQKISVAWRDAKQIIKDRNAATKSAIDKALGK